MSVKSLATQVKFLVQGLSLKKTRVIMAYDIIIFIQGTQWQCSCTAGIADISVSRGERKGESRQHVSILTLKLNPRIYHKFSQS